MTILLIILCGMLNAVMDKTKDHFGISVFKNLKPRSFWMANDFVGKAKVIGIWVDAWHVAKIFMLISICVLVVNYDPITEYKILDIAILYFGLSGSFLMFYNLIFTKKP